MEKAYVAYPSAFILEVPGGKKIKHLLWGDFVSLLGEQQGEFIKVRGRGKTGWMRKKDVTEKRLLEIYFVDIGQGDGAFLVMPDGKFMLIDAGEADNMYRFLCWRFNLDKNPNRVITIPNAIMSHPDSDHYHGFAPLFNNKQFKFDTVYHNGIIERAAETQNAKLGPKKKIDNVTHLTDVIVDQTALKTVIDDPQKVGNGRFPTMLKKASASGRVGKFQMLCSEDGFMEGYEDDKELKIHVLAPVPKNIDGKRFLQWFEDVGKTKNGHSVVIKLEYKRLKVLLGGDLNIPAEEHLLSHYTGLEPKPASEQEREELVKKARETFECHVAKACHHGSADFSTVYLQAVNPFATIVSSGDDEPHCHPRPDALGAFGKNSRGDRPLIFNTELARSSKENIKNPTVLRKEIKKLFSNLQVAMTVEEKQKAQEKVDTWLEKRITRSVTVYGLINLRTDGERVVLAQKLEIPRDLTREEWDIHKLESDEEGNWKYISKHED